MKQYFETFNTNLNVLWNGYPCENLAYAFGQLALLIFNFFFRVSQSHRLVMKYSNQ